MRRLALLIQTKGREEERGSPLEDLHADAWGWPDVAALLSRCRCRRKASGACRCPKSHP